MIYGLDHVSLRCPDRDKFAQVLTFYHDTLKLPILREWDGGVMLAVGSCALEIFAEGGREYTDSGAIRHFALAVDSADEYAAMLKEAGYDVFLEPYDVAFASEPPFCARVCFCHGVLGETVEFFETAENNR